MSLFLPICRNLASPMIRGGFKRGFRISYPVLKHKMALPSKQKAVYINECGDSVDVIQYGDIDTPKISKPDDIIIQAKYAGVNFIDSYFRKGIYAPAKFPHIFGKEAVGTVVAVGDEVSKFSIGDKVAFLTSGAFAQYLKLKEDHVQILKIDKNASDKTLELYAASLLQGLTALTLVEDAFEIKKGQTALVWAASGGVGKLLIQVLKLKGAKVLAISSTSEKLKYADKLGADFLINSSTDDIVAKVKEYTNGEGVDVSYDSVGKVSFKISIDSLKRKGSLISYGNASGPVGPISITVLSPKNLKLARPVLFGYLTTREEWEYYTEKLFSLIDEGKLAIDIHKIYPLEDYKQATKDLESRLTTGKLVLSVPQ